ncbi:DUF4269 domain-containing protein [Falsibacillus albus]|uniref:DUF4269 domain-containing protein n=1 Tax=Falsibacillus albus TaxID=2478915 RepID=A0A3L7JSW5_9BACI|nr:DUF4269 domain-containing protein [Falsibacillus albus]RLQ93580.1 DUF4269 domain-containing protein [Falsibacillus albus]
MFENINYLRAGNEKQNQAYKAITNLGIMESLREYHPTLCGTLPIGIDVAGSDLDIIMEVHDLQEFEKKVNELYGGKESYIVKKLVIRERPVVKANFNFDGFEFELFAQPQPVKEQYAYLHMIIENSILHQFPGSREKVIALKKQGVKTEPAFCVVLQLEGIDPYESLIEYGKRMGMI